MWLHVFRANTTVRPTSVCERSTTFDTAELRPRLRRVVRAIGRDAHESDRAFIAKQIKAELQTAGHALSRRMWWPDSHYGADGPAEKCSCELLHLSRERAH